MYRRLGPKELEELIKEIKAKPRTPVDIPAEEEIKLYTKYLEKNHDPHPSRDKTENNRVCTPSSPPTGDSADH